MFKLKRLSVKFDFIIVRRSPALPKYFVIYVTINFMLQQYHFKLKGYSVLNFNPDFINY